MADLLGAATWALLAITVIWATWRYRAPLYSVARPVYELRIPLAIILIAGLVYSQSQMREVLWIAYGGDLHAHTDNPTWALLSLYMSHLWAGALNPSTVSILAFAAVLAFWSVYHFWFCYLNRSSFVDSSPMIRLATTVLVSSFVACAYLAVIFYNIARTLEEQLSALGLAVTLFALLFSLACFFGGILAALLWATRLEDPRLHEWAQSTLSEFYRTVIQRSSGESWFLYLLRPVLLVLRLFSSDATAWKAFGDMLLHLCRLPLVVPLAAIPYLNKWGLRKVLDVISRVGGGQAEETPLKKPQARETAPTVGTLRAPLLSSPGFAAPAMPRALRSPLSEFESIRPSDLAPWRAPNQSGVKTTLMQWRQTLVAIRESVPAALAVLAQAVFFGSLDGFIWGSLAFLLLILVLIVSNVFLIALSLATVFVTFAAVLLFVIVPLIHSLVGIDLASDLGSIAIANAFLAAALGLFYCFKWLGEQTQFRILAPLILLALGLSWFDYSDNHRVRELPSSEGAFPSLGLKQAFQAWYAARRDRADFAPGEYPVYIVAASGGGIYAAYHSAFFLSSIQDRYPNFAHHVFAISGVSGGSLGAATFASLIEEKRDSGPSSGNDKWFQNRVREVLSHDFLARVTAAALFSDVVARVLPCLELSCPSRSLDRAQALERSFEAAWQKRAHPTVSKMNPFARSVYGAWDPRGDMPALLLNATEVETGERVIVAPFRLKSDTLYLNALLDRAPKLDIALSTAIGLSARFPGLTPAGSYNVESSDSARKRRLVDGGYFENSGVATARDVLSALKAKNTGAKFIVIALIRDESHPHEGAFDYSLGELLSPLRTLDSTREARGRMAVKEAHLALDGALCMPLEHEGASDCGFKGHMRVALLDTGSVRLPLGWVLSERSRQAIESSVGNSETCEAGASTERALMARRNNGCLIKAIGIDLARLTTVHRSN